MTTHSMTERATIRHRPRALVQRRRPRLSSAAREAGADPRLTGWYDDWNSDDLGCLPSAVEITVTIQPTYGMTEEDIAELAADELPPERMYSLIVNLPAALPPEPVEPAAPVDTAAGDSAVLEQEVLP